MGRNANLTCKTCQTNFLLGYGSYITWIAAENIAEYDAAPGTYKNLQKNINLRQCLADHDGHDFIVWSTDWASVVNGALVVDLTDELLISDFLQYKQLDLPLKPCSNDSHRSAQTMLQLPCQ